MRGRAEMPLEPWEKQFNAIDFLLQSCLNWQETASTSVGKYILANVDNVSQSAEQKVTFLQDALIYSLRYHLLGGDGVRNRRFNFREALTALLHDDHQADGERIEIYFYGLATAKLFRAQMTTRFGGPHGVAWGTNFRYPRWYQGFQLAKARKGCFVESGAASAAQRLAQQLLNSAGKFVEFVNDLTRPECRALRVAIVEDRDVREMKPVHRALLLSVWHKGTSPSHGLPMDKLWARSASCVYTKNCIGYDEFVAKELEPRRDDDCRQIADHKLGLLLEVEQDWKEDWKNVVQNWWCCGFTSGIYSWEMRRNGPVVITSGRKADLRRDAMELVELVKGEDRHRNTYQKVENFFGEVGGTEVARQAAARQMAGVAKAVVRLACGGKNPDDILHAVDTGRWTMYTILFLVATTQTKKKLQDCWK